MKYTTIYVGCNLSVSEAEHFSGGDMKMRSFVVSLLSRRMQVWIVLKTLTAGLCMNFTAESTENKYT